MRQKSLKSLVESAFPQVDGNSTGDPFIGFSPTTILETFVPGYGAIHKFLLVFFGFDVTVLVSLGLALFLGSKIFSSARNTIYSLINSYYMSDITVSSSDEIHSHIIAFLAHKYETKSSRRLMAETSRRSTWQFDKESGKEESTNDTDGNITWLNFSNQAAKTHPRFTPAMGSHDFWHEGTYFNVRRKELSVFKDMGGGDTTLRDKQTLTLSCYGRSTEPIKRFIQDAKVHFHLGHNAKTIIKRPATKDMRRYRGQSWVHIAERPCRPMKTVVLDEERKHGVMVDINEYLKPSTARWHANRGIPYRRGYLFYGPPGTGKTSLTFALAGHFGLDIHVVSLLEPTLTEEELGTLFTALPARCIVLLEDIDTAGLLRAPSEEEKDTGPAENSAENELNVANLAKALKKANRLTDEEKKKGISLSGLLNIIDGVASHEGRVLVMTTNQPEKLDEALIRPGRVDYQVAFGNATQTQIKELFERMYTNDLPRAQPISLPTSTVQDSISNTTTTTQSVHTPPATPGIPSTPITSQPPLEGTAVTAKEMTDAKAQDSHFNSKGGKETISESELSSIATAFARQVPNQQFSPAEIQGFLLSRKTDPRKALREVGAWVEGLVEQKKKGRSWAVSTEEGNLN
ncbi:hypothetical protein VTL71DRAFT_10092 [Oculimacula yallundae]|uniref:Mitochondrial chaperone BCS1 n=1 Tax=Oculimacula yallundae TaxID=86028 RepID=A0ABR4BQC1_9HELO